MELNSVHIYRGVSLTTIGPHSNVGGAQAASRDGRRADSPEKDPVCAAQHAHRHGAHESTMRTARRFSTSVSTPEGSTVSSIALVVIRK